MLRSSWPQKMHFMDGNLPGKPFSLIWRISQILRWTGFHVKTPTGIWSILFFKKYLLIYLGYAGSLLRYADLSSCDAWASLPHSMWSLSSLDPQPVIEPASPYTGRWILNHWTMREVPVIVVCTKYCDSLKCICLLQKMMNPNCSCMWYELYIYIYIDIHLIF